ncbi:efflux transporter outer membrane subunit [Massilia sp. 9I]|uniref:efflux transporter outer membrane subunit n=1 Tax=Massilia sp. 9I TaxID=2653152 RepID=UPI0012F05E0A|nr:efflux transporter outer membrane subunit [Massilia sp. 9I]VXA98563.1 Outer membrane component of tripartite multidrug resistance system [Massilia sp. 9I]
MRLPRLLPIAAAALALSGCLHVPSDGARSRGPDFARAQYAASIALPAHDWPAEQWWRAYRDPQLDALVATALRDSPNLTVAKARVASAGAAVAAERAAGGAQVGLETGFNRQRYSSNGFFPPPIGGAFYNDASVQLRASYDFDWWERHRSLIAAALGEADARRAEAAQAAQVLAASVAQSYLRLQMLWARQDNTNELIAVQRDLVAGRRARMAQGLATSDELRSAELDLATLGEQAQHLDTDAEREREALRALIGGDPDALVKLTRVRVTPPSDSVPRELGLELLARRPDLQAARWRVEAQLGRVASAEAAFRPDINLAGALGLDAISLGKLLRYPSRTLLLGATLDLPLFDGGRLNAQLGMARSERDELLAEYNKAVLDAVAEVAREAATLQGIAKEAEAHAAASRASSELAASAEARLKRGLANRATVLQARQAVLRQRDVALQLVDAQLQTQVALTKALGGGYHAAPTTNNPIASKP